MFVAFNNIQLQNFYQVNDRNEFNATTLCTYGNALVTHYSYNPYGLLTRINSGNELQIAESGGFDPLSGGGVIRGNSS